MPNIIEWLIHRRYRIYRRMRNILKTRRMAKSQDTLRTIGVVK